MDMLIAKEKPVMLVGSAGSGKTVSVAAKLNSLSDSYSVTNVPLNFYTTSGELRFIGRQLREFCAQYLSKRGK